MFVHWSNLTLGEESQHRLPGYRDPAAVRTFEAPEALDTRFYEVQAKSVLNHVPPASSMPFRWTVNPYRGCAHACQYCISGDAQVLMADGRATAMRDIQVGDRIYGTRREGAYRRFVATEVLDKWSSIKPAWEVRLEDGTRLIASDEHRFLSSRGWKHVTGAEWGPLQRPHLTLASRLLGPGGCVAAPEQDVPYRRGYLTGMIRGDGNLGSYSYERVGRSHGNVHRFRLALADEEALARSEAYLRTFEVETTRFLFAAAAGAHREMQAVRASARATVEQIRDLVRWPLLPSLSWIKGYLAGIFDAEGSCSRGILRIANGDPEILHWVTLCMARLGFSSVLEPPAANGVHAVRLLGGLPERMRFFLGTDPAITRKRTIEGAALKCASGLDVREIRPLGMTMRMYDITTGTGDFIANGVVSHNCFARPTHTYLGFDAGRDFEREIVVKVNAPEVLRAELGKRSWKGEHVALGTNTDPYQWVEGRYRLMEGIWEALRDAANPCSILTKSPLLLRDLDLMLEISKRAEFTACLSIPTLDEKVWRETEPRTPNPKARLEAVAELNRAGISAGVLIAPLMPGINDAPHQVEPLLQAAADAGAKNVAGAALHLRGEVRGVFMDWLTAARPDLVPRYKSLYRRAYAPQPERERLAAMVRRGGAPGAFWRSRPRERAASQERRPAAMQAQQSLF
jgi:DNA repair photolyase